MKQFAIYIGGEHPRANIEVHDMRFIAARTVTETYDELRRQWWGTPDSLHVDAWAAVEHADGHDVELAAQPFTGPERLYYVNLGGYAEGEFLEMHRNVFVVAKSMSEAKTRALSQPAVGNSFIVTTNTMSSRSSTWQTWPSSSGYTFTCDRARRRDPRPSRASTRS